MTNKKEDSKPANTTQVKGFDDWDKDDDGFEKYESDWVGFYDVEKKTPVIGTVLECINRVGNFGPEDIIKLKLKAPTSVVKGKGDEGEEFMAQPGDVIAVRVSSGLEVLKRCVENKVEVKFRPSGQTKTRRGMMTTYDFKFKGKLSAPIGPSEPF